MRAVTTLKKALFAKEGETPSLVSLPHTWNAFDGQDGGNDYWRGAGTYEIDLPDPTPGKRQYIEIQGANHAAAVFCNGQELGTHRGGFSTFRYELTSAMKDSGNVMTVIVSNAKCDIYPQRADFTFFGGLYRDVRFIEVPEAHFDLLKHGSDAVFVTPRCSGRTRLDVFPVNFDGCTVCAEILDANGRLAASGEVQAAEHTVLDLSVREPHLWNGTEDPYCYSLRVTLNRAGEPQDIVTVTFGYRSFHVSPDDGFWLNGRSMPLRGVSRHQDRQDKGWALSKADHEEDIALIREIGANTVRLAHYQHDRYFYELCDQAGFAVWAEIPFISQFIPGKSAYDNTVSQMTELIVQNYNHPSIFFWGIANEITIGGFSEALYRNLCDLNALCKRLDPGRLTTMALIANVPMDSEYVYITDVVSYNYYYGWYSKTAKDNGPGLDRFHAMNPDRCFGVSEYGADCLIKWHSAAPVNHDYTEEYAACYHHELLRTFAVRPYLWGTHVWNMFDFAADGRDEGGDKGRNNKGLVTYDRKVRKDAFYLYQAYWTKRPMVHIAGRRFADRAPGERDITVYTNCEQVTLLINGAVVSTQAARDHAAVFRQAPLRDGSNTVCAMGEGAEDTVILNGVAKHNTAYDLPDILEAFQAGNWFDSREEAQAGEGMTVLDGFFSVEDTVGELFANDACVQVVRGWFMSRERLPLSDRLTMVSRMAGWQTARADRPLCRLASVSRVMNEEDFAQLNRHLNRIRK